MMKCAKCGYSITVQRRENGLRRMICSGRYNLSKCDADIRADLTELENAVAVEIEKLLTECPPSEPAEPSRKDVYAEKLDALARLEKEREEILASRKREKSRPAIPDKLVFSELSFEEKKIVAAQFIERIEVTEDSAEIKWAV